VPKQSIVDIFRLMHTCCFHFLTLGFSLQSDFDSVDLKMDDRYLSNLLALNQRWNHCHMVKHYHRGEWSITFVDAQAIILAQFANFLAYLDCSVISNTLRLDPSS
jgi:hypothetical protein